MSRERLLIVDDETDMLEGLRRLLGFEVPALEVLTCADPLEALALVRRGRPDVVLLDVRMPGIDGLALLGDLKAEDPSLTCIMMTAHGTIEMAVEAIKTGAYDFITKPFQKSDLLRLLTKGLERNRLILENRALRRRLGTGDFHGLVGRSPAMQSLFDQIRATARTDYSVLVRGESGTGKELVAHALHRLSRRSEQALVTVNCAAIPENLLESELFGHRRGAFTGADRDHKGLFEEADGGTLLLDEIGDLPPGVQTKLLRALQEGEIRPLGSPKPLRVDVRIVAATNQDLESKIRDRSFREDLYYRLNVITLKTPALREVPEDIPLMASHFALLACTELDLPPKRFGPQALQALAARNWPGNVRQLQNAVRRAVMLAPGEVIADVDLALAAGGVVSPPPAVTDADLAADGVVPYKDAKAQIVERFTRAYVDDLLRKSAGNVTQAAALSGIGRPSLQKIIRRFGIRAEAFKPRSTG
jgi:DNA-binding NtrC family response regulator